MIIAFDLDGTLSDPLDGVSASINYALTKMRLQALDREALKKYIGPSLQVIFGDLLEEPDESLIRNAILYFRERYFRIGYKENILYPGVRAMLQELKNNGHTLYVATSKRPDIAQAVTDLFKITQYFKEIMGCGLKKEKHELLAEIKKRENSRACIMVGDRLYDMKAGRMCRFYCIGALWGYGSVEELIDSGADILCNNPKEIINVIKNLKLC